MKVLLTGFEPFGGYSENASWVVAREVATRGGIDANIALEQMPVSFARAGYALRQAVEKHNPDIIVMLGQTSTCNYVKIERVALNLMDAQSTDNDGFRPDELPIYENAPTAILTQMPIKALCEAVKEQGIAAKVSNSCGLYVCNRLYYEALSLCRKDSSIRAIFVHLPLYEGQRASEGKPTMPLEAMIKAIQTLINKIK